MEEENGRLRKVPPKKQPRIPAGIAGSPTGGTFLKRQNWSANKTEMKKSSSIPTWPDTNMVFYFSIMFLKLTDRSPIGLKIVFSFLFVKFWVKLKTLDQF